MTTTAREKFTEEFNWHQDMVRRQDRRQKVIVRLMLRRALALFNGQDTRDLDQMLEEMGVTL